MKELLPKLIPLNGDFDIFRSLVNCRYENDDLVTGGPTIRFSLGIGNVGEGPLHIILSNIREEDGKSIASGRQIIHNDNGTSREIDVDNFERTLHDFHEAWHYPGLASFGLYDQNQILVAPGKKTHYCMVDIFRIPDSILAKHNIVNSPTEQVFFYEKGCLPERPEKDIGISVGWADSYGTSISDQYIDVSGIPSGEYILQLELKKTKLILADNDDNKTSIRIKINKEEENVELI